MDQDDFIRFFSLHPDANLHDLEKRGEEEEEKGGKKKKRKRLSPFISPRLQMKLKGARGQRRTRRLIKPEIG